ncbi:MAG: hypothetical protein WC548_02965 [Candidatus Pacearchaeota archaeon]
MKRGEFNFVWLFAIVVGGLILFLAVYGATKIGDTKKYQTDSEIAKQISILTDPMQAGFAEGSFSKMTFKQEIKIKNLCSVGNFGENEISVSTKTNNKWNQFGAGTIIPNKYIFSAELNEGKEFYITSKPFNFPYEVSDMIFLTSKEYCFSNSPDEISEEIKELNIPNIKIENCSGSEIKVCFGSSANCDIVIYGTCLSNCDSVYEEGVVEKKEEIIKYVDNLLLAAIFSDKTVYDCNINRLLQRTSSIAELYSEKADISNARNCNTNLKSDLLFWKDFTVNSTSDEIISLNILSKSLQIKNERELCKLW